MKKMAWQRLVLYALAIIVSVVPVFAFDYAVSTSFKTGAVLFETNIIPSSFAPTNYITLFTEAEQLFVRHLLNSTMVSTIVVGLSLFLGGVRGVCARPHQL